MLEYAIFFSIFDLPRITEFEMLKYQCRRQFRGKVGSDGFEKVLIGTRGARETFLDGRKGRAAKNSVLTSGAKQLKCCVTRTVKI